MRAYSKSKKKNILVIGGSSSLGRDIIEKFISNDWQVIATYNSNKILLRENLVIKNLNLLSPTSLKSFTKYLKNFSKIDYILFLPSILNGKKLQDYSFKDINRCMNVNFNSQVYLLSKILFSISKSGFVLFVSSISGEKGSYDPIYAASKGAQISFVKSISKSLAPDLRINILSPSLIKNSNMYFQMEKSTRNQHKLSNPMKSLIDKVDIADIVYDLSGNHWKHLNGQVISINGGLYS